MKKNTALAERVQNAMDSKQLSRDQLAEGLGMHHVMVEKLLCGEIIPSTHLENKLEAFLGIPQGTAVQRTGSQDQQRKVA
jgi:ribosome-binding protein aMBF1 (putative translation factor)